MANSVSLRVNKAHRDATNEFNGDSTPIQPVVEIVCFHCLLESRGVFILHEFVKKSDRHWLEGQEFLEEGAGERVISFVALTDFLVVFAPLDVVDHVDFFFFNRLDRLFVSVSVGLAYASQKCNVHDEARLEHKHAADLVRIEGF